MNSASPVTKVTNPDYYKRGRYFMLSENILPGGEKQDHNGE